MLLVYEIFVCHAAFVHCQTTIFHIPRCAFETHNGRILVAQTSITACHWGTWKLITAARLGCDNTSGVPGNYLALFLPE